VPTAPHLLLRDILTHFYSVIHCQSSGEWSLTRFMSKSPAVVAAH